MIRTLAFIACCALVAPAALAQEESAREERAPAQSPAAPATTTDAAATEDDAQPSQPGGTPIPPGAPVQFIGDGAAFLPQRRGISWDFQIEGGWAASLKNELPHHLFGRARAGMLIMHEPQMYAFGPTFELGGLIGSGVGGQIDIIQLATGFSLEAGAAVSLNGFLVSHLSLGYALLGVEWQQRFGSDHAAALLFKLRLPVGAFVYLTTHP